MHLLSIQDKHKIMHDIDTNSYLTNITQLTIESKHNNHDTSLQGHKYHNLTINKGISHT